MSSTAERRGASGSRVDARPLRVEMILPSLIAGGMEMVTARLAMRLGEAGHHVGVTCLLDTGPLAPELEAAGHRVAVVEAPGLRTNIAPTALTEWLRSQQPDVVHVHSGAWLKGVRAARLAGVPRVIFTEHGLNDHEPWFSSCLKRCGAHYTDTVVAVSEPLKEYLVHTAGIRADRVTVIANGVDTMRFNPTGPTAGVRARLGIGGAPVVGHVARLAPVKNQPLMVDAFAEARKRVPNAHMIIVGEGSEREPIEARIAANSVEACVHLIGEARDIPEILREMDVFALPSKAEGTSMSVLEAMASGVSIVASSVGGTPDLLNHGECGRLVPPNDVSALANAFVEVLSSPTLRSTLGSAGRERAVRHYSETTVAQRYEVLYRAGPSGSGRGS